MSLFQTRNAPHDVIVPKMIHYLCAFHFRSLDDVNKFRLQEKKNMKIVRTRREIP
ncbi:hypothetical protein Hanom_Chr15g01413301 [Helianthus anomalus]